MKVFVLYLLKIMAWVLLVFALPFIGVGQLLSKLDKDFNFD